MYKQHITAFKEQLFRRIGYTVGLWNLLDFQKICVFLKDRGSVEESALLSKVRETFSLLSPDAQGKIDIANSLGLMTSLGSRYALAPLGHALCAIVNLHGPESPEVRAFFLRRVVETDADLTLTLLLVLAKGGEAKIEELYPQSLNALLAFKRIKCQEASLFISIKRQVKEILTVRELKKNSTPFAKLRRARERRLPKEHECIEIAQASVPTYIRHVTGPRKGWLVALGLAVRTKNGYEVSNEGLNLLSFLRMKQCLMNGFAVIQPDEHVLLSLLGKTTIFTDQPVNQSFFDELTSYTFTGSLPACIQMADKEFLEAVSKIYPLLKIGRFEQVESSAVNEVLQVPLLIKGIRIDFESQLESAVKHHPEMIYRLSSPRGRGAYISLRPSSAI